MLIKSVREKIRNYKLKYDVLKSRKTVNSKFKISIFIYKKSFILWKWNV